MAVEQATGAGRVQGHAGAAAGQFAHHRRAGVKGFESGTWQGLLAPASLPPAALARLTAEVTRIIRSPEVRERLVSQGAKVHTLSPADFKTWF